MLLSKSNIVHREIIPLKLSPEKVREFILTPDRILDYYPLGIDGAEIDPGRSFYCRANSGVSLLELLVSESSKEKYVIKVTTAISMKPPFTAEKIKAAAFFTMLEDWEIEPDKNGSILTKTWRDVVKHKLKFAPIRMMIKNSAKKETEKLKTAWEKAGAG